MNYGMEVHDIVQETGIKTIPKKNKCKKAKWLSEEALHDSDIVLLVCQQENLIREIN